ncbi:glutamate-cysteine ligase family protein [Streptomyces sp. A1547]|uniref:glutamate-cysteine ligase family protein n=1 Tax=Streptomyces sp. A1547 TaxID=2563105 RepID=UPI001F0D3753|nr:glutamate-cysteine ligase family protein [Streptomyces sp. A1547]
MHARSRGRSRRDTSVAVLNRLRPWLPTLLAVSVNSPFRDSRDTSFASWRTVVFGRWAVSVPTPHFAGLADYGRHSDALVEWRRRVRAHAPHRTRPGPLPIPGTRACLMRR